MGKLVKPLDFHSSSILGIVGSKPSSVTIKTKNRGDVKMAYGKCNKCGNSVPVNKKTGKYTKYCTPCYRKKNNIAPNTKIPKPGTKKKKPNNTIRSNVKRDPSRPEMCMHCNRLHTNGTTFGWDTQYTVMAKLSPRAYRCMVCHITTHTTT